jgi:hypothetical protein
MLTIRITSRIRSASARYINASFELVLMILSTALSLVSLIVLKNLAESSAGIPSSVLSYRSSVFDSEMRFLIYSELTELTESLLLES